MQLTVERGEKGIQFSWANYRNELSILTHAAAPVYDTWGFLTPFTWQVRPASLYCVFRLGLAWFGSGLGLGLVLVWVSFGSDLGFSSLGYALTSATSMRKAWCSHTLGASIMFFSSKAGGLLFDFPGM